MNAKTTLMTVFVLASMAGAVSAAAPAPTAAELMSKLKALSDAYDEAPNDIKKSAVFSEARAFDKQFFKKTRNVVTDWKGTIRSMRTEKGGGGLSLSVRVVGDGIRLTFAQGTGFGEKGIPSKSPVYKAAGDLSEGSCVLFTGKVNPKEDSISESGAMRAPEYKIKFTALKACP